MSAALLSQLPVIVLSGFLFYGAFSRLTHGAYTPAFYAYQNERQPDDGSAAAILPPIMDITLGTMLLLGNRRIKAAAATLFALAQTYGLVLMVQAGNSFGPDIALLALSALAALGALS